MSETSKGLLIFDAQSSEHFLLFRAADVHNSRNSSGALRVFAATVAIQDAAMTHRHLTAALAMALGLSASGALAQSYNAPAGIPGRRGAGRSRRSGRRPEPERAAHSRGYAVAPRRRSGTTSPPVRSAPAATTAGKPGPDPSPSPRRPAFRRGAPAFVVSSVAAKTGLRPRPRAGPPRRAAPCDSPGRRRRGRARRPARRAPTTSQ